MAYSYNKIDTHFERPGHLILLLLSIICLVVTLCVCVLLALYVSDRRPLEDEGQVNSTSHRGASYEENITDADLGAVIQSMWHKDTFRVEERLYGIDLQSQLNKSNKVDHAPNSFFSNVDLDLHARSTTYRTFMNLLNNFQRTTRLPDPMTPEKWSEIDVFLDAVLITDVMRTLQSFLAEKELLVQDQSAALKERLFSLWFSPYSRSPRYNVTDSSGFEHVFVGEIRGSKTMGLHSWIQLHLQELAGNVDYMGYHDYSIEQHVYNIQFRWYGKLKKRCSFFVGTSPEFDLAVYTLCALARPQRECSFVLNNKGLIIQTYDINHVPGLQIGTAYPVLNLV